MDVAGTRGFHFFPAVPKAGRRPILGTVSLTSSICRITSVRVGSLCLLLPPLLRGVCCRRSRYIDQLRETAAKVPHMTGNAHGNRAIERSDASVCALRAAWLNRMIG